MPQGHRPDRVGDQIRQEVTEILAREMHDPGIGFVTITRVQVTPDLQLARVFYTTLGSDLERRNTAKALRRAGGFLRHQVGQRLNLRRVPVLEFVFDKSIETQDRVERLIQEIHEADAERQAASDADPSHHDPERHEDQG
jgi:ribosome-binding factor A